MAHNLEENNGIVSFVENGKKERAWHHLGQVFDGQLSVKEALELSHADYKVDLRPVIAITPTLEKAMADGTINADMLLDAVVANKKATMRMDKERTLGVVSDSYGIVQNEDAFKFIDTLVSGQITDRDHTPVIETAGVLGNGERIFITAKFPEQIILDNKGNDLVEMYVVFTTSHDGTGAVNCMVTPVRVVCNNTLNYAMQNNRGKISFRHSLNVMNRLDLTKQENVEFAYKALNMYNVYKVSLEESFNVLRKIKVNDEWVNNVLADILLSADNQKVFQETNNIFHEDITTRGRNQFLAAREAIESGIGQEIVEPGTGLWLINGLTTYFQNGKTYKNEEYKFESIQQGDVSRKLQRAYDLVVA